jgi:hypothetical protein
MAQCTIDIPANAIPVSTIQGTTLATGQFIWVCDGGLAAVTGNGNTVVVEELGTGTLIGDNNILITKNAGTFVNGNNNQVFILDPANVADVGTNTQITDCAAVVFTYTNAPTNGCLNVGMAEAVAPVPFALFPNPVYNALNLTVDGAVVARVRLFDAHGRVALDRTGNMTGAIDVTHLPAGLFLFVADTDHGQLVRTILKD